MSFYKLDRNTERILKQLEKISIQEADKTSAEGIRKYTRANLETRISKKIYYKLSKNVYTKTFIIPVSDAQIIGYYFEKISNKSLSGLNPLIIFYHGGGWTLSSLEKYSTFCNHICDVTGASVIMADYRLAPKNKFPTPLKDCYSTLLWAAKGARYWKTDPDKIYVMGDGAGGNLAAEVSRFSRDKKGPKIAGQILLCPVTDGRMRTKSYETYTDCPTLKVKDMIKYIHNYQREPKDILNVNFSPLLAKDHSRLPETLIAIAEYDPLHDDGKLYAQALSSADTPVKLLNCNKTIHGFYQFPKAEKSKEVIYAISQFIGGRRLNQIEMISPKEFEKQKKQELKH